MTDADVIDAEIVDEPGTALEPVAAAAPSTLYHTDDPGEIIQKATEQADVLKRVLVERGLITRIQQSEHVRVEGWTLLGTMLGVFPVVEWTRELVDTDGHSYGWEARVVAKTMSGQEVGAAEAQCTRDERTWAKRDGYALRSMAQTRATSKALRGPLGFVVHLAGFNPTPLEEMPSDGHGYDEPVPAPRPQRSKTAAGKRAPKSEAELDAQDDNTVTDKQVKMLGVMRSKMDLEREDLLAIAQSVTGREVGSAKDLTKREATKLIDYLVKQEAEAPVPDDERPFIDD